MVKIRLQRYGAKKSPFYRIVATDSRNPRDGRFIEVLGTYDPTTDPETVTVKAENLQAWVDKGAKLTDTVRTIVARHDVKVEFGRKNN